VTTYFGLYYPYTAFQDVDWLKMSALYWDQLYHIVPNNFMSWVGLMAKPSPDDMGVRRANETIFLELRDAGYIKSVTADTERTEVGREFLKLLQAHGPHLRTRYPIPETNVNWKVIGQVFPHPDSSERAYIFSGKIDAKLSLALQDLGLADGSLADRGGALEIAPGLAMHARLARVYMTALAEAVARSGGIHLLSDDPLSHVAVSGWSMDQLARALLDEPELASSSATPGVRTDLIAGLALQCIMPTDLSNVSVKTLIAFRDQYAEERGAFQNAIQELVASIGGLEAVRDGTQLLNHVQTEYRKSLLPQLKDLKRRLRGYGISTIPAAINAQTALPPVLAGTAAQAHIASPAVLAGSAVALSMWSVGRTLREARKQALAPSATAYLYRIETGLRPSLLARRIRAATRLFE
jgi:hypothetical protein